MVMSREFCIKNAFCIFMHKISPVFGVAAYKINTSRHLAFSSQGAGVLSLMIGVVEDDCEKIIQTIYQIL